MANGVGLFRCYVERNTIRLCALCGSKGGDEGETIEAEDRSVIRTFFSDVN